MQESNNSLFSSKDSLKDKLKKKINENANNGQMLLILDNVCHENAIHTFDIGCRILITTQKKDVWCIDSDSQLIEVIIIRYYCILFVIIVFYLTNLNASRLMAPLNTMKRVLYLQNV